MVSVIYYLCGNCSLQRFIHISPSLILKTKQFYAEKIDYFHFTNKKTNAKKEQSNVPKVL